MDIRATQLLTELLKDIEPDPLLQLLEQRIINRTVVICGAGPSLEQHIQILKERNDYQDMVFVAADGAVSLLLEQNCTCNIIVTDLDGDYNHIKQATQNGALTIVHGHGDNMDKIREMVPRLGMILGSTQVKPTERAFLWGGFTDGDRACYVVTNYSPRRIILVGMDFGKVRSRREWRSPRHGEKRWEIPRNRRSVRADDRFGILLPPGRAGQIHGTSGSVATQRLRSSHHNMHDHGHVVNRPPLQRGSFAQAGSELFREDGRGA